MPSEKEITIIQKATIYDLQKILKNGDKDKTYTIDELIELMDAYIKGVEQ